MTLPTLSVLLLLLLPGHAPALPSSPSRALAIEVGSAGVAPAEFSVDDQPTVEASGIVQLQLASDGSPPPALDSAAWAAAIASPSDPTPPPGEMKESPMFGDDIGRPLYQFKTVELPENRTGRHCIAARMDKTTHALSVDPGAQDVNSIAWACFNDQIDSSGWSALEVDTTTDDSVPLAVRAYTAGIVEGLLTAERMTQFKRNVWALFQKDTGGGASLMAADRVVRMAMVAWEEFAGGDAGVEPEDDMPKQAWAALLQLRGLRDGSNFAAGGQAGVDELSMFQVMLLNMHLEIPSIVDLYSRSWQARALDPAGVPAKKEMWPRWGAHEAHGSMIVRRVGNAGAPEDLLAGHVTFGDYAEMTRIIKHYTLNFGTLVKGVTMTSYPGCVSSTDDYIMTDRGLVAMSATLGLPSTGEDSTPAHSNEGLPSFVRAIMATRIAASPRMWAKIYGHITGIAGAKQWLLVDYGKLKELQPLVNDTLWIVESLPRVQRSGDVTQVLRDSGFFEGHGVPHFAKIREIYGLPKEGQGSYEESKASSLVDKGTTISSLSNAQKVLTEMVSSRGETQIPITARNDLSTHRAPIPNGGIDAKVAGKCLVKKLGLHALSGPPLTPAGKMFNWTHEGKEIFPGWPHEGLPNSWNFTWVSALPAAFSQPVDPSAAECEPEAAQ